jgi:DNA-binding NarL/FixJ family response regulator
MNTQKSNYDPIPFPGSSKDAPEIIRTFLLDESPFVLALLARVLAKNKRINIVGSATDGRQAFQFALMSRPHLILIDLHMSGLDGLEMTRWFKQLPHPPVVFVLTSDDSPLSRARSLAAGADGFFLKGEDLGIHLQTAIENFFGEEPETAATSGQPSVRRF